MIVSVAAGESEGEGGRVEIYAGLDGGDGKGGRYAGKSWCQFSLSQVEGRF
jgi:hypothetical protein